MNQTHLTPSPDAANDLKVVEILLEQVKELRAENKADHKQVVAKIEKLESRMDSMEGNFIRMRTRVKLFWGALCAIGAAKYPDAVNMIKDALR